MIEVESKIKISNPRTVKKKILEIAKFEKTEKKQDDYYTLEPQGTYPKKSLRIRKKKNVYIVNFKKRGAYKNGIWAKNETEFVTSDIYGFIALIKEFGFRKWLTKEKKCKIYRIEKNFQIELNHVKKLGWFIEIEYLSKKNPASIKKAQKKVSAVLKKLEVKNSEIIKEGYTKMLWNLKHQNKK